MIKSAIFDLDGTLSNTVHDLKDAVNYALVQMGLPVHSTKAVKSFVGNGIPNLLSRSLPEDRQTKDDLEAARRLFFEYYKVHFADKTAAYDGIYEMLAALKQKGIALAVCTNKEDGMAKAVVDTLFPDTFNLVCGQSDRFPLKPDPASSLHIMKELRVTADETVFIGDSAVDIRTAKNAGAYPIGVAWGFREKEELIKNGSLALAETPWDIIKIIDDINFRGEQNEKTGISFMG